MSYDFLEFLQIHMKTKFEIARENTLIGSYTFIQF